MKIDWLFVKFILVGILNTAFGYGAFALLMYTGLHYSAAVVLSTIAGILFNFKTTGVLVFKNKDNSLIFKFIAVYTLVCITGIIILRLAEIAHINLYFAGLVSTGICAVTAFLLNKNWVFKKHHEKN
ncbi:MAG TPA: GtrA family protein [Candidatus Limenecus avicola]|jgi:gtrA family protein|uniref:GtrA family protein n=1 Tax=Candidatus Limenecus avicola TaxID=2840847 RepID=A0A9D1N0K0_9CLOT|nr:GtrA family protein [Clostridium sp.]HIU92968.1 GtrA family protein [Candidatus Limenecus avicola]